MISVITVTLNAEKTLEETLVSIIRQTCRDFEIVAVDGGSTDSTLEIFQKYSAYIGTLISEKDSGIYNAMNKGIRAAKGDILFFLNAQDTLYSEHVFARVEDAFHSGKRPFLVFGDVFFTNKTFIPHAQLLQTPNEVKSYKNAGYNDPAICHQAIFYHRHLFDVLGGYDEKYRIYADFDFNIRAFYYAQNRYVYIPEIISNFDLGGVSTIVNPKYQRIQAEENAELRQKKAEMWAQIAKRKFLCSKSFSSLDGGYYLQFCGVRLDWTPFMKYFALEKIDFPLSLNFAEELPSEFRISGFLPLEGWGRWVDGHDAEISFSLNKWNTGDQVRISLRLYLCLLHDLQLTLSLNGQAVGRKAFSSATVRKTTDVKVEFFVPGSCFLSGENKISFHVDGCSNPKELGISGDDRLLGVGIQTMQVENHFCIPRKLRHWYEFAKPLTLPFHFSGYYTPEKWGAWLEKDADIELFPLSGTDEPIRMLIAYRTFLPDNDQRELTIYADGVKIREVCFPKDLPDRGVLELELAKDLLESRTSLQLTFRTENPVDVHERFEAEDDRLLGIGFERVCFLPLDEDAPPLPEDKPRKTELP